MSSFNEYIINGDKLLANIKRIKRYIGRQTKICAVIKADAYGLGVDNVCPILSEEIDYYAVVTIDEALNVRKLDKSKPILVLGVANLEQLNDCVENNIILCISSIEEVKYINKYINSQLKVHLKLNTGMNRYGIKTITQLRQILNEIKRYNKIKIDGVYTHFATKAENLEFIDNQYNRFERMLKEIRINNLAVHCANSFVATTDKLKLCNMVRVGFSMYSDHYERLNIENVVSIHSRIIFLNHLKKGESVGYDRTHIAKRTEKIGVVPLGYADGFIRNLGNHFKVLVNGQYVNVVGRVCMDCFMVDLTGVKGVFVGSKVVVLGEDSDKQITLEDYANAVNFSPYEVLTNFRTKRMNVRVMKSE